MAVEKEDMGLSLSLRLRSSPLSSSSSFPPEARVHSLQLNLMPCSANAAASSLASPPSHPFLLQKSPWKDLFPSSSGCETRSFLGGIDVNRAPGGEGEDEGGASSPNSTLSSLSGKRAAGGGEEMEAERTCSRGVSDEEEDGDGDGGDASSSSPRKKLRLSKDQSAVLEEAFREHNTLNPKQKLALAKQLNLRPRQVEVWFQNRRARTKLKQTEVDCEFLKRCCENLTEENRRLQKEVQELRALKLSPQLYKQMTPPTTLTMCPSCQRVALSHSTTTATHKPRPHFPISSPWAAAANSQRS
ncbi:hypothetical protein ACLOJK_037183 [Asimina triloba]